AHELLFGTATRIEFDGQGHKLKNRKDGKSGDGNTNKHERVHDHAQKRDPESGLTGNVRHWHQSHSPLQRGVSRFVLQGVPRFMSRNTHRRQTSGVKVFRRKKKRLLKGVIMISEMARHLLDGYTRKPRPIENFARRFRS